MGTYNITNFITIDDLSHMESPVHRIHPLCKVIVCISFIIIVMSFPSNTILPLAPFFFYPIVTISASSIPAKKIIKMILPSLPFVLMIAIFNPLFDRQPVASIGNFTITSGMISFLSIIIRSFLTISAVLLLVATSGIYNTGYVMQILKIPSVFVVQTILLYRYIFILTEEAITMRRAAASRLPYKRHPPLAIFGHILSSFIARSVAKSTRIYSAMLARGFNGKIKIQKCFSIKANDIIFTACWFTFFIIARIYNLSEILGNVFVELLK